MKGIKIVVLAKQVPDTRNVGPDAMKADGTVNRAVLPAIFNPEDLNALEQALRIKDMYEGTTVTVLTMGPGRAAETARLPDQTRWPPLMRLPLLYASWRLTLSLEGARPLTVIPRRWVLRLPRSLGGLR
jgi:hypothetical protein